MEQQDLVAIARAIIDTNRYMTLATADGEGQPWASPVFYAAANYTEFYWISAPGATHSRNLAQRPQLSIVIFDSGVPAGTGQAVYMSAAAAQVAAHDLGPGLAVYPGRAEPGSAEPGSAEPGSDPLTPEQVQAPAPYRLYRATVSGHSVLCPRTTGRCALHGLQFDHRTPVRVAD